MIRIETKKRLTPADFKAQLWFGLWAAGNHHMLPREPIEWGQDFVSVKVTERATYCGGMVFDREEGGVPLGGGCFDEGPHPMNPKDTVNIGLNWEGQSIP